MKNVKDIYPINLQLFGEENGADPNAGSENAAQATEEQAESKPRMYTEEEVKAKLDHHMAQYRKSESKRIEQAREEARSEAEKLAKMNEAQRAEHEPARGTGSQGSRGRYRPARSGTQPPRAACHGH